MLLPVLLVFFLATFFHMWPLILSNHLEIPFCRAWRSVMANVGLHSRRIPPEMSH